MTRIFDIADQYIDEMAALDPVSATYEGIAGHDTELTDYSPAGAAARNDLDQRCLQQLEQAESQSRRDFMAREVLTERLTHRVNDHEAGEFGRELSFASSPLQDIRSVFDQMPQRSSQDWEVIAKRLEAVPLALARYRESLELGMANGNTVAHRQVVAVARQARIWAGTDVEPVSFLHNAIADAQARKVVNTKLSKHLEDDLNKAAAHFNNFATFLLDTYLPAAPTQDAVGNERYLRAAESYLGMAVDPAEIYGWGWDEIGRLQDEIDGTCKSIDGSATVAEVVDLLDRDHERYIHGEDQLVEWLTGLLERAISGLDGTYFDIPDELKVIRVKIAPPGGPANQYYVPPSEDLTRPGAYWYPTNGKTRFPIWSEISTAYHEGVPGHHLQCGVVKVLRDELSRFQRNLFISGHGEGWALYAERLMDEIGFLERPEYRLDMLMSQMFRAARVVTDIGLHLQYRIPSHVGEYAGSVWTPEIAHAFMKRHSSLDDAFIASEIVRYLGIPGQAISYKVGERVWMDSRAQARKAQGDRFDLRAWHNEMLALGPMGLDLLQRQAMRPE